MALIPLKAYASKHARAVHTVRVRIKSGKLKAEFIDGRWMIDESEPYTDSRVGKSRVVDLTGQHFGQLEVKSLMYIKNYSAYWLCECACKKTAVIKAAYLLDGTAVTCGCGNGNAAHVAKTKAGTAKYHVDQTNTSLLSDKPTASNSSGRRGVSFNRRRQDWEAYIQVNKKKIHLGYHKKFSDAVKAREAGEKKYFNQYLKG